MKCTVKGTLYEQDVVILDGDVKTTMKPPAADWLREAIDYRIRNGWPRRQPGPKYRLPKVDIVVEQFFAEQVNNFFSFWFSVTKRQLR